MNTITVNKANWVAGVINFLSQTKVELLSESTILPFVETFGDWILLVNEFVKQDPDKKYWSYIRPRGNIKAQFGEAYKHFISTGKTDTVLYNSIIFHSFILNEAALPEIVDSLYLRFQQLGSHTDSELNAIFKIIGFIRKNHKSLTEKLFLLLTSDKNYIFPLLGTYMTKKALSDDDIRTLSFGLYIIISENPVYFPEVSGYSEECRFVREIFANPKNHKGLLPAFVELLEDQNDLELLISPYMRSESDQYNVWLSNCITTLGKNKKLGTIRRLIEKIDLPKDQWFQHLLHKSVIIKLLLENRLSFQKLILNSSYKDALLKHTNYILSESFQPDYPNNWFTLYDYIDPELKNDFVRDIIFIIINADKKYRVIRFWGKLLETEALKEDHIQDLIRLIEVVMTSSVREELVWLSQICEHNSLVFSNISDLQKNALKLSFQSHFNSILHGNENLPEFPKVEKLKILENIRSSIRA